MSGVVTYEDDESRLMMTDYVAKDIEEDKPPEKLPEWLTNPSYTETLDIQPPWFSWRKLWRYMGEHHHHHLIYSFVINLKLPFIPQPLKYIEHALLNLALVSDVVLNSQVLDGSCRSPTLIQVISRPTYR